MRQACTEPKEPVLRRFLAIFLFALPVAADTPGAFVWPVSGYIGATEKYRWGQNHTGSADLYTQYGIPVVASRSGVAYPGQDEYGAWYVWMKHQQQPDEGL